MASEHHFTAPLNASKALRRRTEAEEHALINRLALLRDEEARALARADSLERRAADAAARHDERIFEKMMWSAARETGVHPLRAVGGAMSFPTRAELAAAGETLAALASPIGRKVLGRPGSASPPSSSNSPLADTLDEVAAEKGARLAEESRVPPEHPVARAAWVSGRRATSARALLRSTSSAAWARALDAGRVRQTAAERKASHAAWREERLNADRRTVLYVRDEAALSKDIGQINAAARERVAKDAKNSLVVGNTIAAAETSARIPLLRAAEADLRDRVAAAAARQRAAAETLARSLTAPPLPLPFQETREMRAASTLVVADAVGRGVLDTSQRPKNAHLKFVDNIPVNTLRSSLQLSEVESAPQITSLRSPGPAFSSTHGPQTLQLPAVAGSSHVSSISSGPGGVIHSRFGPQSFWPAPISPLHASPLDRPAFRSSAQASVTLPPAGVRSPLTSTFRPESLESRLPNVAATLTGRSALSYTGRTALELVETLFN